MHEVMERAENRYPNSGVFAMKNEFYSYKKLNGRGGKKAERYTGRRTLSMVAPQSMMYRKPLEMKRL
jgi:hypothetical protein